MDIYDIIFMCEKYQVDLIGWLGNIFLMRGLYIIGDKNIKGFYLCIIASIIYLLHSILLQQTSLMCLEIFTFMIYVRGIKKWKKEDRL